MYFNISDLEVQGRIYCGALYKSGPDALPDITNDSHRPQWEWNQSLT